MTHFIRTSGIVVFENGGNGQRSVLLSKSGMSPFVLFTIATIATLKFTLIA